MNERENALTSLAPWVVALVFCALAGWFAFLAPPGDIGPVADAADVHRDQIVPGARRTVVGEPAAIHVGSFALRCMECHRFFDSPPVERRILTQHTNVVLRHGQNTRCFNCHDRRNRGVLVRYDGTSLSFDQVPQLCSECHGTVYRDWELGMHGKTMGSWDAASGRQVRLACNECHDPHSPAYPRYVPLPAPNTLRMGDQSPRPEGEEGGHRSPLMRRANEHEAAGGAEHEPASQEEAKDGAKPASPASEATPETSQSTTEKSREHLP